MAPQEKLLEEWGNYDHGAQMIVCIFDQQGQALSYLISHPRWFGTQGWVTPWMFPGHLSIGTGGANASFWFNFRGQNLGMNIKQSCYHTYEASRMAYKAPTVNDDIEILIATAGDCYYTSKPLGLMEKPLMSVDELSELFKKYGPQETRDDFGFPRPSVPRRSMDRQ